MKSRNGLLKIEGPAVILTVVATDGSSNTATATAKLEAQRHRNRRNHGDRSRHKPGGGDGGERHLGRGVSRR